ncbi:MULTISPECIES: succinate dehydrogenase cytochrome b558 subunit [Aneurinibacillus]|uniref:Succinate dehydrogenase cytochrome b558 subunit n=1 Tax=Aneurinibacillus thermoaerophilus TaxID=143495 RepID=A0A1G8EHY2_ANETH|nr:MULTISPECIES: succinate dehydrogenase cytochrome b558 subunit [Aneurinibacillus]AMA72055.1 succinate dehydrogenase [Aneurinibacillus sp. XH2]MED0677454.1 succinate dehydrogenase cytochrome b558 subunit [Aneurinibacillus thermoaerophilus]MED0678858.1 succinate dehydrogenase cytochrome b558 subunit [Aneurinibacillus thermoaerophilus]MED0736395.1 succinate dehydrogenase cytochrome b558 subunit [Aneurinibacillus thermoaerophilus]MED0755889.1 succinate dehydrogenase cytochrome b558 subunit [Aneu
MATTNHRHFFNRKLHSLLGVVPIGGFLFVHLLTNYYATRGESAFLERVEIMEGLPFLALIEILFIFLPILYHGIYGLYIAFQAKNNVGNYGYFRNVMFMLQRVTGVITLIFITWHVWETKMQMVLGRVEATGLFTLMNEILANPVMLAFYIVGLLSATFHFANGLWSFAVSWGITVGPRAQRISTYVTMVVFVFMSAMGLMALFAFANPVDVAQAIQK